jgi:CTP:molybdopterin cytidylyltransferase MocA
VTCGLILAAGESRRMGSPKALLEFQGETFLDRLIGLFSRRCSPVIAVLGAQQEMVRAGLRRADVALLVENPDFRLGQLTSMQCGLRAVPAEADGVLFTLVDHPAVTPPPLTCCSAHCTILARRRRCASRDAMAGAGIPSGFQNL